MGEDRRWSILLVEDNAADARLLQLAFVERGVDARIEHVTDGAHALDSLAARRAAGQALPHLILLDLKLPGRDGIEVLAEIKGDPALRQIPVIVLSTSASPHDIRAAYDRHANSYITKPLDLAAFDRIVRLIDDYWLRAVTMPA